ncbi:MAG: hypothetical protein ACO3EE_00690 [Flavobacteriales bacterium]
MDLKNKKQELSEILSQLPSAGSYDELISLSQKVMMLSLELKISEQVQTGIDRKIKDAVAEEVARVAVRVEVPVKVEETKAEVVVVPEEKPVFVAPVEEKKEEIKVVAAAPVRAASISEKLQTADVSIAAKLSKSSIKDLTKAVSINQKILFTKELFKGDSFAFNEAIGKLNAFENKEEAMGFLQNDLHPKFSFKSESESYAQFVELIERRYV